MSHPLDDPVRHYWAANAHGALRTLLQGAPEDRVLASDQYGAAMKQLERWWGEETATPDEWNDAASRFPELLRHGVRNAKDPKVGALIDLLRVHDATELSAMNDALHSDSAAWQTSLQIRSLCLLKLESLTSGKPVPEFGQTLAS